MISEAELTALQERCDDVVKQPALFIRAARTDLPRCIEEIRRLRQTLAGYVGANVKLCAAREALKWYADKNNYNVITMFDNTKLMASIIDLDEGDRARQALGEG